MIMDGNRRWAREKKLKAVTLGHKKGLDAVRAAIRFCRKKNIKHLSLYTFSLENFKRSSIEKNYIFKLLTQRVTADLPDLLKEGIRVRFVGDRSLFPQETRDAIEVVEEKTKHLDRLQVHFLFCYGSQQEVLAATKQVAQKVKDGVLSVDQIDDATFRNEMWMGAVPDPDVLIRTGGVTRISNFLLYQLAYSELLFLDYYWPEVTEERLEACLEKFETIQRNFGK